MANSRLCSIPNCGKPVKTRGWCGMHYHRWQRRGDPLAVRTALGAPDQYLREVVFTYNGDDCLIWPYGARRGYGRIWRASGSQVVSRLVCEHFNGPPPSLRHHAAHSCGGGHLGCVNGAHLSWETPKENIADKHTHGTIVRGGAVKSSKLTEANVRAIRRLAGTASQHSIAVQYGISDTTASKIIKRQSWAWLD